MNQTNNSKLTVLSQNLRKNMTKEERHLWYDFLKYIPQTIHRQKVIGNYILDFYCSESNIAIELDGSQHGEKAHAEKDHIRDMYLKKQGIKVLRYTNEEIRQDFDNVCMDILQHLESGFDTR